MNTPAAPAPGPTIEEQIDAVAHALWPDAVTARDRAAPTAADDRERLALYAALATLRAVPALVAALKAMLRLNDDMSRFVGQMALRDYALFNEAPIKARAALAAVGASTEKEQK